MPKTIYTYIDNSNFFIEGQRLSAVHKGMALDLQDAFQRRVFDFGWQPDYGKLYQLLCKEDGVATQAKLWGSPPPSDSFWKMVERKGFQVTTYERSHGTEKKVDVAIAVQMAVDSATMNSDDEVILVAGDKDFIPALQAVKNRGIAVTVAFWGHAAKEMRDEASAFFSLNQYHSHLTR